MADYDENTVIDKKIKPILHTILSNCKVEAENKCLQVPLNEFEERVAFYTGLPKAMLNQIFFSNATKNNEQSIRHRIVILKALLKFYKNEHRPNFKDLYNYLCMSKLKITTFKNIDDFRYALISMGFDYRKTNKGSMIVEDAEITFERYNYIKNYKKLRNAKIRMAYVEERYITKHFTFNKPDFDNDSPYIVDNEKCLAEGFYFYHVLSDAGLENYIITNKICVATYQKFVVDVLFRHLKKGCAVVIDNHPIHGKLIDQTITRYHTKADMLNWLRMANIPYSDSMCKAELYELISRCKKPSSGYELDRLLNAHGHEVLRLPSGCDELSPSVLLWNQVKEDMKGMKIDDTQLENAIISAVTKAHKHSWKPLNKITYETENTLLSLYASTEEALDKFVQFDVKNVGSSVNVSEQLHHE